MPFQKDEEARWSHVPAGGGYGYRGPLVRVLTNQRQGSKRVMVVAVTKDGLDKVVTVDESSLERTGG